MAKSSFRFGTVGSPKSTPAKPGGSVGAVSQIAALNLNALELGWVQSVRVPPETCSAIKAAATELDVAISVHAPYFINLNADEEEWPKITQKIDGCGLLRIPGRGDRYYFPSRVIFRKTAF